MSHPCAASKVKLKPCDAVPVTTTSKNAPPLEINKNLLKTIGWVLRANQIAQDTACGVENDSVVASALLELMPSLETNKRTPPNVFFC